MQPLISKVQYNNFEAGEFVDIKERSYEEVIKLIEGFPWTKQREHLVVSLTNPSITIEGINNDYLKIALYYQGKFVLYYLEDNGDLFTKSFERLEPIHEYVKAYFEKNKLDTTGFKKTNNTISKILIHFRTNDFVYKMKNPNAFTQFAYSISFLYGILVLFILNKERNFNPNPNYLLIIFFGASALFLIGFPILILYNHYINCKNKILIISKANPIFYFGDLDDPKAYNKSDIAQIIYNGGGRGKGSKLKIEFNNHEIIELSLLLLLPEDTIYDKFYGHTIIRKTMNPLLKN
jgi:hypothetical protein